MFVFLNSQLLKIFAKRENVNILSTKYLKIPTKLMEKFPRE